MDDGKIRHDRAEVEAILGAGRPSPWRRRALVAVLLLFLGAAAAGYALLGRDPGSRTTWVTEPADRADLTVVVTATGTVEPTNQVEVSSELSGIVRKVSVDYNSTVHAGDVLAELDTDKLSATVDSSRAKLVAARAQIVQAQATVKETRVALDRKRALVSSSAVSRQDLDSAQAAYDRAVAGKAVAEADAGVAEAQLSLDETNLTKARIVSPINGVVLSRNVDPGQTVATSFQAPVLFTIAEDLREMEVQVDVDEADVGKVRDGQPATFSVDAYPERRFEASIRELRFGSEVVSGVVTYKAVLATANPDLLLRPGMTATAEITVDRVQDALTVPNAALRFTPPATTAKSTSRGLLSALLPRMPQFRSASPNQVETDHRRVWVLRDGVPVAVPVVTGLSDGRRTAILEGELKAGDAVVVDSSSGGR